MSELVTIDFQGSDIIAIEKDGEILVPLKRICENLGIDWNAQRKRIERDSVLSITTSMVDVVTTTGKKETLCLPLEFLNGFLFGIGDSQIQDEFIREKIIQYKLECYKVLYNHFFKKQSIEILNPDLSTVLNNIASILPAYANQINMLDISYRKIATQQDEMVEELREAFRLAKDQTIAELKNSIVKLNTNSAIPNGRMVTLGELKRDPALGSVVARFISNRSSQSLAQSLVFWTEHNGQKLGKSGSANLYPYDLAITFFDETINPYIKKYI